jgi:hypothetical protein
MSVHKAHQTLSNVYAMCLHNHGRPLRVMALGAAFPALLYTAYALVHAISGMPLAEGAWPIVLVMSLLLGALGLVGALLWTALQTSAHFAACTRVVRRFGPRLSGGVLLAGLSVLLAGSVPGAARAAYVEQEQRPFYARYIESRYGVILKNDTAAWSEQEARIVYLTLEDLERKIAEVTDGDARAAVRSVWAGVTLVRMARTNNPFGNFAWTPPGQGARVIEVPDYAPENGWWRDARWTKHILSDELAHAWDFLHPDIGGWNGGYLSSELPAYVGADASLCLTRVVCGLGDNASVYNPGGEDPTNIHSAQSPVEDWSGSFAQYMQPLPDQTLGPKRYEFVKSRIELLMSRIQ